VADGTITAQVRSIIAAARTRTFPYEPRPPPRTDWSAYDAAKTQELPDVIRLIRRFVETAEANLRPATPPIPPMGRPRASAVDVAKALVAQAYVGKANRVAQGLSEALGPRLGIAGSFSYKTIERGYGDPGVGRLLEEVFRLTNVPVQGLERVFSIDGSGMVTSVKDNYEAARSRQRAGARAGGEWPESATKRVYNVAVIGVHYKLLAAWRATNDEHARELAQFPEAFAQAKANHPAMGMLLGDGLYAGRPQVHLVAQAGVVPRFLPRRNVTLKRFGVGAWIDMLLAMARDPQRWFTEYHGRSISEMGFSITNVGPPLRKRLDARKRTESFLRAVVYNLRRLAQLRYLMDVAPLDENYAC
jgi:transposase